MISITPQQIDAWLHATSETEHLEFKEAKNQFGFDNVCEYFVAIGNEGGGRLVLGITNKRPRQVVGTAAFPDIQKVKLDLYTRFQVRVDVEEVLHTGRRILVFHIPSRQPRRPFQSNGKYLMRSGESVVPMTPDQLEKIFAETAAVEPIPGEKRKGTNAIAIGILVVVFVVADILWRMAPKSKTNEASLQAAKSAQSNSTPPTSNALDKSKADEFAKSSKPAPISKPKTTKKSEPTFNSLQSRTPSNSIQSLSKQVSAPTSQTFRELVLQLNKNTTKSDREHLSAAFYDFAQSLEQGRTLMYKGFNEAGLIGQDGADIVKTVQAHVKNLRKFESDAMEYGKANMAVRAKWSYYPKQTTYVFGDDPDNLGWEKLANGFALYATHLETWAAVQNKDDKLVQNMLAEYRGQFNQSLNEYGAFTNGCRARLDEMKDSIQ